MFDKEKAVILIDILLKGVDIKTACLSVGFTEQDLYKWLDEGKFEEERISKGLKPREAKKHLLTLWKEVRKARAMAYSANVENIKRASIEDWRAAAWLIDKNFPNKNRRS